MEIIECHDKKEWDSFITEIGGSHDQFLQSWDWMEFQNNYGRPIRRFFVKSESGEIQVAVALVSMPLVFNKNYLFSPHGPVFRENCQVIEEVYAELKKYLARNFKAIFWRLEPTRSPLPKKVKRVEDVQPALTSVLDLHGTGDDLLADMKQKTRYNIRLAEKKDVVIEFVSETDKGQWENVLKSFWALLESTSERHGIRHHPIKYYKLMIERLVPKKMLEVAVARQGEDIIAINLLIKYGDTLTYLHGASSYEYRKLMAPYLLQWKSIERAQKEGYVWYDFYGIGPADQPGHKLAGVTRFKNGFGGEELAYPGTFELPLRAAWYNVYRIIKLIRNIT